MAVELGWAPNHVPVGWASTEDWFRAMGTDCHVIVVGPARQEHLNYARDRITHLERLWTRFQPESEISRLGSGTEGLVVAEETFSLVEHATLAWKLTDGRFDPTMAEQLADIGYDRSFEQLGCEPVDSQLAGQRGVRPHRSQAAVGCGAITLDRDRLMVKLLPGQGFDPGGIGKGFAADLVSQELMARGAWGVLVNLGGDLRVRGTPACGDAWVITISEPAVCEEPIATVRLVDCGLATSTTKKRRWSAGGEQHHHLLDPAIGLPHETSVDLVTVIAGDGWWAEAAATALIGDDGASDRDADPTPPGCAALRVFSNKAIQRLADFQRYEA